MSLQMRWILALACCVALTTNACGGSDDDGGDDGNGLANGPGSEAVCEPEDRPSECGKDCSEETGSACAEGFYCKAEGSTCTADCSESTPCGDSSTCDTEDGRCIPKSGDGLETGICNAPDMLIVLDVSGTMAQNPAGAEPANITDSKWSLAVNAISAFTDEEKGFGGGRINFGVEVFPADPGMPNDQCRPIADWQGWVACGPSGNNTCNVENGCEPDRAGACNVSFCDNLADVVVPIGADTSDAIAEEITLEGTPLCWGTPIYSALEEAAGAFEDNDRDQFVVLITDGKQSVGFTDPVCAPEVSTAPYLAAQQLKEDGIGTYVIGFDASGGVDPVELNNIACAGGTASDMSACVDDGDGLKAPDDMSIRLYLEAENERQLLERFDAIKGEVGCCNCDDIFILE